MGNSRKLNSSASLLAHVEHMLQPIIPAGSAIVLGLSGGVDSVVLLHLLQQISPRHAWRLRALHVHHGISPQADAWAAFCAALCEELAVPVQVERVDIAPLRELGIEAAARKLRHAALLRQQAGFVALAHHLDDQVETMLLQLLRGAGVRGASAMPLIKRVSPHIPSPLMGGGGGEGELPRNTTVLRPLLDVPRAALVSYAQQHALQWVEDESNADDSYPRNFLRQRVLPLLEQRFPAYRATLARSARHFAEAGELLDDLARQDARGAIANGRLDVEQLRELGAIRGKNLLRYFLAARGAPIPDSTRMEEMLRQLCDARQDASVCVAWQDWQVRRYRSHVYVMPRLPLPVDFTLIWNGEAETPLPSPHGVLCFSPAIGQGVSQQKIRPGTIEIRPRRGGEKIQPDAARPHRSLKNLLQEHDTLPWQRDVLPLLFCDDELIYVPGVAIDHVYRARPDEAGVIVRWYPSGMGTAHRAH